MPTQTVAETASTVSLIHILLPSLSVTSYPALSLGIWVCRFCKETLDGDGLKCAKRRRRSPVSLQAAQPSSVLRIPMTIVKTPMMILIVLSVDKARTASLGRGGTLMLFICDLQDPCKV